MHIAINTLPLESGHNRRGTGVYTRQLIEALKRYEPGHTYSLFTRTSGIPRDASLVHYPFFDPFFLTLPIRCPKPLVVTVHDLIPIAYPDHFPRGIRGNIKWALQKRALSKAAAVITDSEQSKQDIARYTAIPGERIHVVYLAPSGDIGRVQGTNKLNELVKRYDLGKLFILYVGDVNWNKNIPNLLHAFKQISVSIKDAKLVLVGKAFLNTTTPEVRQIDALISRLHIQESVKKLGYVSNEDLSGLYTRATCTVVPSFAEGFGLPILEAMKCGSPVVAARGSSLSEIAGPAISVDPNDPSDIARGISRLLRISSTSRAIISRQGMTWSKRFTWEKVARETVRVYTQTLRIWQRI